MHSLHMHMPMLLTHMLLVVLLLLLLPTVLLLPMLRMLLLLQALLLQHHLAMLLRIRSHRLILLAITPTIRLSTLVTARLMLIYATALGQHVPPLSAVHSGEAIWLLT
jgi:hypothetical protein